jgi:hypothetical protein
MNMHSGSIELHLFKEEKKPKLIAKETPREGKVRLSDREIETLAMVFRDLSVYDDI